MSRPAVPLRQFVVKVHSRCDLACDHCYVYQGADQSWRGRPMAMSDETIAWTAQRIAEHAKAHQLADVHVVLHGGEPLLAGPARLRHIAGTLRAAIAGVCDLDLRIHTNGVLLDEAFCDLFADCGVQVGISIDGYRAANDRHRRYADGRSSYDQVLRAVDLLRTDRYRDLYAGLLCTIDVANDPVAVYEALLELDPPRIDFLLPHATWDEPPARPQGAMTAYADWLIAIFDRWEADGRPVGIRTFDSIISTGGGGESLTEALGLGPSDLVVVETDGSYEQADSLKTAYDGAPATGFDVFTQTLDTVGQHPGILARQQGLAGLCRTCQECPVVTSCGGGLYAHRYRAGTGFDNPSAYCADLLKLISHVHSRTRRPARAAATASPAHDVPAAEFRALAAGFGTASAIEHLAETQGSLRRALLATVYAEAAAAAVPGAAALDLPAAWDLLTRIDAASPRVLADVLGHPYVRVWAVRCLEQLRLPAGERARTGQALAADLGHLGAIAAAAAIRAGTGARVTTAVRDGAMHLPTLGRLVVSPAEPPSQRPPEQAPAPASAMAPATVTVEVADNAVTVQTPDRQWTLSRADLLAGQPADKDLEFGCWQPVRTLTAPGISVTLEDTDPYRDCHQWAAAPRLTDPEFADWQRGFREAWAQIQRAHSAYAPGLAAGLRTITPLSAAPAGRDVSATARQAFGAVAVALPGDQSTLALLLIHEFQHVKLGAVLDLYDLYDAADTRLYHAPWRDDPRPLEGLLQGTYAHIAVTDFWRARRSAAAGPAAEAAEARFAHWRDQTAGAIESLAASGSLTRLGEQFIDGMRQSIAAMLDEPVPAPRPRMLPMRGTHSKLPKSSISRPSRKWRKIQKACLATVATALVGALAAAGVDQVASRLSGPEHVIVNRTARSSPHPRSSHHSGGADQNHTQRPSPPPKPTPQMPLDPLTLISEDPVNPSVVWVFPQRLILTGQQLAQLNYEINAGQISSLNDYLFGRGGYAPSVYTRLVLKNTSSRTVQVGNIKIIKDCQAPLNGTLVNVTGMRTTGKVYAGIQLGYKLNRYSPDAEASTATSQDAANWKPGYFFFHSVPIKSGAIQAFDIRVVASNAACSFWYKITILDGATKDHETIGDGNGPFRISTFSPGYARARHQSSGHGHRGYREVYLGGTASPVSNGALTREAPEATPENR